MLLLTGCVPGKVSQDQILEDITENESFIEDYDMEIKDFSLCYVSYGDERYEESGFWLNGFQLTKVD